MYARITIAASLAAATLLTSVFAGEQIKPDELARVKQAEQARITTIAQVYDAVVAMYPKSRQGGGSGVVIDEEGFVLTNNHVMAPIGEEGFGGLADTKLYKLTPVGTDPTGDVAVARLHGKPTFAFARLGDSRTVQVGDFCLAMGNPFTLAEDHRPTVTLGIISGVERYQRGQAGNIGIYGNCLQFDTSINPGNSGGPLFDMAGRVIGINGRGSFEERARVNVGLGYAISIEQVKNFLPDLRAAKIALHGALDATFADQEGKVICDQINLDAPIAARGMQLGDTLVALDGQAILHANQVANLLSTYPANWPVNVVFERAGVKKSVWVRLKALPVAAPPARPPAGGPRPGARPGTRPATRPATLPATQPATQPATSAPRPVTVRAKPGEIRNLQLNAEECQRILRKFRNFTNDKALAGHMLELTEEIVIAGKTVGRQRVIRSADGRFRVDVLQAFGDAQAGDSWGFDGSAFWEKRAGKVSTTGKDESLARGDVAESRGLASFREESAGSIKDMLLEGGDRAQGQIAFRVRITDDTGRRRTWWFSLLGPDGAFQTRLLKFAPAGDEQPMWTYSDYRPVGTLQVPHCRALVSGLGEEVQMIAQARAAQLVPLNPAVFGAADAK